MTARAAALVAALAIACAAPSCPRPVADPADVLVPVEHGHVVLAFRGGLPGRASVRALRLAAAPAVDRVVEEPWPSADAPNLEYDGQLGRPWPGAVAGVLGAGGELLAGDGRAELRRAGRDPRRAGLPDAVRFEGHMPLGEDDRAVGVEWTAYQGYPGAPPWSATSSEPADLLWCPLSGPCVSWERATRGVEGPAGELVEPPRVYCVAQRAPGGDPSRATWRVEVCRGRVVPEGLRVDREDAPPGPGGLVRTAIRAEPAEVGDYLVVTPPAGVPALRWTLATRSHDEYADGRQVPIDGCGAGGRLRFLAACGWSDDAGPVGCRYDRERAVGPDEVVEVDLHDGAQPVDLVSEVWIEMSPGLCLAALAGAPGPGSQAWWSAGGPRWPLACDLAERVEGPGWSEAGCPRDPPASLEYSTEPLRCEGGECRVAAR